VAPRIGDAHLPDARGEMQALAIDLQRAGIQALAFSKKFHVGELDTLARLVKASLLRSEDPANGAGNAWWPARLLENRVEGISINTQTERRVDTVLASLIAGSKAPDDYVISKDAFSKPEPYGIMLRKDDPAFKKVVDGATAALYTSGEAQKIYDKWFTQKIPPKGLNLNAPISAELKNEFAKPSDSPDPDSYK